MKAMVTATRIMGRVLMVLPVILSMAASLGGKRLTLPLTSYLLAGMVLCIHSGALRLTNRRLTAIEERLQDASFADRPSQEDA